MTISLDTLLFSTDNLIISYFSVDFNLEVKDAYSLVLRDMLLFALVAIYH